VIASRPFQPCVQVTPIQNLPMKFACPSAVLRDGETNSGATEPFHTWSEAVAEG
jgi:gamma-glutamyltranspeptidase/glutathione hydrolase